MRALLCWRSDRLPILQITDLTGSESLEGHLGPPPVVWAEKLRGLLLGTEPIGHKFLVEQPQAAAFRSCERPTVEEEHERVVPGPVWRDPVDTQQPSDPQGQAELLSNFALSGLKGGSLASAIPPGRSQSGL